MLGTAAERPLIPRHRQRGALALVTALVFATSACSAAGPGSVTPTHGFDGVAAAAIDSVPEPLPDRVTVRIGVFPNITHAPGLLALAADGPIRDLLPNADLQVNAFNSGSAAVEAMFADAIDLTFVGPNPAINAYAKSHGEAVRVVSGSTSGGAFFVVRDGINAADDLRGTTIASPSLGNTQDVALRTWLAGQGLHTDIAGGGDVHVVPQENAQTLETFVAGTIDGAWVPEPWATRLIREGGAHLLVDERDLWPEGRYVTTQLMVATPFLNAHPDVVSRILLAVIRAVDAANEDPASAQGIVNREIERYTGKTLGADLMAAAWSNLVFTVDPLASSLDRSAEDAVALGLLDDPGDLTGLYDLRLLNAILQAVGRPAVEELAP
jgi:sulfonate transport system substrate-binding protein